MTFQLKAKFFDNNGNIDLVFFFYHAFGYK